MQVAANGIRIEVEDSGGPGEPLLLVMGLGGQLIHWPPDFVEALGQAGYRVIRIDNRDAGLSQHLPELGVPNIALAGLQRAFRAPVRPPYTLQDMARDTLGALAALDIQRAHIVGMSMGGMIAQRMAIAAPERCATLTSIMSSSGARGLPSLQPKVLGVMLTKPRSRDTEAVVRYYLNFFRAVGSPANPVPEGAMRELILQTIARSYDPAGNLRQLAAIMADDTRADELARVRCPTLVLHGDADPFVLIECGRDTARRIPGARFAVLEGAGHDLAPQVCAQIQHQLLPFLRQHPMTPPTE